MTDAEVGLLDVAVGVLTRPDGRFLLTQRPSGKPMAGYWEFPGGKLEVGESVFAALVREFREELGLEVIEAVPWVQRIFSYPHAKVRLHYWRILVWQGVAHGREGQILSWETVGHADGKPWLPGALPLKRWLLLPSWYAISNATGEGHVQFLRHLDAALAQQQISFLQLREKSLESDVFKRLFQEVQARTREHGIHLLVNSAHPERYWHMADGVHYTTAALLTLEDRPQVPWCAASCHDEMSLMRVGQIGLDFAVLGPVKQTPSHPDSPSLGWERFCNIVQNGAVPVYALGGLERADLAEAMRHGAQGVAAIRASWVAPDSHCAGNDPRSD